MATNLNNFGVVNGRLARDPEVFQNSDGSTKFRIVVACQKNYKGKDGQYGADFVTITKFVGAGQSAGILPQLAKGDGVAVEYTVTNNNYTDKDGVAHYEETKDMVGYPQLRYKKRAGSVEGDAEAAASEAPVEQAPVTAAPAGGNLAM